MCRPVRDAGDLAWAQAELKAARERWATCPEFYERTAAGWERHIAYIKADLEQEDDNRPDND